MNKIIFSFIIITGFFFFTNTVTEASSYYMCGTDRIEGKVTTTDIQNTSIVISLINNNEVKQEIQANMEPDGSYKAFFDTSLITD
ncbi:hypothetical protein KA405_06510 [Patescibacteria group bacterium]|nr:hypothetical protein [Patescibacteria group bacterium]